MKKYYTEYELLVDLPTGEKKGDHFFKFVKDGEICFSVGELSNYSSIPNTWYPKMRRDDKDLVLGLEQMTPDFFKPIGKPHSLYPKFPSKKKIQEYYDLIGEARLVDSVDEVRCINAIFDSDEFYDRVYEVLKEMYNEKYFKE